MTAEKGSVVVVSDVTVSHDCTYIIRPRSAARLFKLWVDDIALDSGDSIEVRTTPAQGPEAQRAGPSTIGLFLLFNTERFVRVLAVNSTRHRARLHWAPLLVDTVTSLTCTADKMQVRVNLTELHWLYDDTNATFISLANEGCTGSVVGDQLMINNSHSQCYTQRQINGSHVTYRNSLVYKEVGQGPIVREHRWKVDLFCQFRRQMEVGLGYQVQDVYSYQVNLQSDYKAEIHLYNDSTLRSQISPDNVKARLGGDLYVDIVLHGQWNVSMHLRQCVARPQPGSNTTYTLIRDGCAVDSETFIVFSTHNNTLFHFKAFEFYSGYSTVYIDCDVNYCAPLDDSPACVADCK